MAKNYQNGPKWVPGVIMKQLGTLTFLIQLDNGMFWKDMYVDQLRGQINSSSSNTDSDVIDAFTNSDDSPEIR